MINLIKDYPELISRFDKDKNENINIEECPTSIPVYWKCEKTEHKHSFPMSVGDIIRGRNCPYCSGRKILVGYNDFKSIHPELLDEWDYDKNDISPEEITCGNVHKKIYWKCKNDSSHKWEAPIASRVKGHGCPYCSGLYPIKGVTDFESQHPELLDEWDYDRNDKFPSEYTQSSGQTVNWKCKFNHVYKSSISHRVNMHSGCPICQKRTRTSFPEQAIYFYIRKMFSDAINSDKHAGFELDIFIPSINVGIEYDGQKWHSNKKKYITDMEHNKYCDDNKIQLFRIRENGCTDMSESDYVTIINCIDGDRKSLNDAIISLFKRLNSTYDFIIDVNRDFIKIREQYIEHNKKNSLGEMTPELAAQWHPELNGEITPFDVSYRTEDIYWWQCKNGHSWQSSPANRDRNNRNLTKCPECRRLGLL